MSAEKRLGGFRVLNDLASGTGSQGSVVRAVCEEATLPGVNVGDIVALKIMRAREDDAEGWAHFKRRTDVLASLTHPNIVRYYGCFLETDPFSASYVVVMELLEGESLKERLAANPGGLDADQALLIVSGALDGMAAAEAAGIVHRDIKPGNIFLCADGTPKLIDFEISRAADISSVSSTGRFAGTFDYMAPEFADATFRGDARSDVFSMGVVFHETLTGATPYAQAKQTGEQADFAFLSRWSQRVEGLCAIHIKSGIRRVLSHADEVLLRALAEKREERFATAAEFAAALKTIRFRELRNGGNAYRLLKLVGKGGFGEVFKARLRATGELVAVKHLLKSAYGDRFRREARVMKQLDDPAFVRLVDYFETAHAGGNEAFLVMAYLAGMPGSSLRDAIKRHKASPLPAKDVFCAFALYAHALATMHRQGIYHRDIKPSNLYYPEFDPGRAAIMDLGIARDVNGTATAGQVPGTLDYMPPEVVVGGSRGDAGMDVYALGLCLYEAISGRMGYPRLPTGPDAFKAFYERAQAGVPPSFTGREVESVPGLLELLRDMTSLDPALRIQDAEQLHRRLVALSSGAARAVASVPGQPRSKPTRVFAPERPEPMRPEAMTRETALTGHGEILRRAEAACAPKPRLSPKAVRTLAIVLAAGVLLLLLKRPIAGLCEHWQGVIERKRLDKIQAEVRQREEAALEAERTRVAALVAQTEADIAAVARRVQTEKLSQIAASNLVDEWKLRWKGNVDVVATYRKGCDLLDGELKAKRARDLAAAESQRLAEEKHRKAQLALQQKLEAEAQQKKLEAEAQNARDEVRNNNLREAEKLAVSQAVTLCKRFGEEKESLASVDADRANWETKWNEYRSAAFYIRAVREMDEARSDRSLLESSRTVAAECGRWLANIATVTAENVRSWTANIDRAVNELNRAIGEKRISTKAAQKVRERIDSCRRWIVGVVVNKTHEDLDFCGTKIPHVSNRVVIFKDGMPEGAALTCAGYEPIRVREDRFQAQAFLVLPRDLTETRGTTRARVPVLPEGVVCFVDGVETKPGEVSLRRGRHHAVYRNVKETYAGIRDFNEQDVAFLTEDGAVAEIAAPSAAWTASAEFVAREKNSGLVARGEAIVKSVKENLKPVPVQGRRDRLQKAYSALNDWRTSEALAVLGEGVERNLRTLYASERRRIRGIVRNATETEAAIATDAATVRIPPGESKLVTFENGVWSGEAHAALAGYEFVMLPRVPSDFEKEPFVIRQEKLVPLPVAVTVPEMEKDVTCRVDGKDVSGTFELRPGMYEGVYLKPDHQKQPFTFTLEIGKPRRLPKPAKWHPSGAFSSFAEAMSSFNSGAVDKAKKLAEKVGPMEDPARRRELEDLKKAIELRERMAKTPEAKAK